MASSISTLSSQQTETSFLIPKSSLSTVASKASKCCCDYLNNCSFTKFWKRIGIVGSIAGCASATGLIIAALVIGHGDVQNNKLALIALFVFVAVIGCFAPCATGCCECSSSGKYNTSIDYGGGGAAF